MLEEESTDGNTTGNTSATSSTSTNSDIEIEVLNGTSDGKILQEVVSKLTEKGYNVTRTGVNETNSVSKTIIANKKDVSSTIMNDIKTTIGTGTISDKSGGSSSKVDVTIIIGKDYNQ